MSEQRILPDPHTYIMHKDFYFFGTFFLVLASLVTLFSSIIFFQIGYRTYQLDAFSSWFWIEVGVSLIINFILLAYFRHKGYALVYQVTLIGIIASIVHYTLAYMFVVLMMRALMTYYSISGVVLLLISLIYAISLLATKAAKQIWLKIEGILLIIIIIASGITTIWSLNLVDMKSNMQVETVTQWTNLLASLSLIPLIILFYQEHQASSAKQQTSGDFKYKDLLFAMIGLSVMASLVVGAKMGTQTYWSIYVSPEEQALIDQFESQTYVDTEGSTLDYLLMKPLNYDTTQKYPLVISLHGGPQSAKTERIIVTEPAPLLSDSLNREKYPAFLFVPQAPPAQSWGGIPYASSIDSLLIEAIQSLKKRYAIDEDRIYLTGISMGGYGTWYLLGTHAELFAAAIPMCGAGDPTMATHMVDVPVWAFHGSKDKIVPVSGSRQMIAAMQEAGGDPRYTEFPDVAHHVWPHVQETEGVLDWLFAQRRK